MLVLSLSHSTRTPLKPISGVVGMNRKFGGGKPPTGTPSLGWSFVVVVVSLLAGASIVHNVYKPDLRLPPMDSVEGTKQKVDGKK